MFGSYDAARTCRRSLFRRSQHSPEGTSVSRPVRLSVVLLALFTVVGSLGLTASASAEEPADPVVSVLEVDSVDERVHPRGRGAVRDGRAGHRRRRRGHDPDPRPSKLVVVAKGPRPGNSRRHLPGLVPGEVDDRPGKPGHPVVRGLPTPRSLGEHGDRSITTYGTGVYYRQLVRPTWARASQPMSPRTPPGTRTT